MLQLISLSFPRKRVAVLISIGVFALAVACSSSSPEATATQQPAATSVPTSTSVAAQPTATSQSTVAPTTTTASTATSPAAPTATSQPAPNATATATTPAVPATAVPTVAPVATATPAAPTATPVVTFTPGVLNTVELVAARDNTLFQSSVGGTSNGAGEGLFAGKTNNNVLRRALVQFDIASAVPDGATIESVELTLSVTRTVTQIQPFSVHRVTADWGEGSSDASANEGRGANATSGDVTWTHTFSPDQTWQTQGGDFVTTASGQVNAQGNGDYTWPSSSALVADVQSWVENPGLNFGWVVVGDEVEVKSAKRFGSREHNDASKRPMLVITFTPPA